MAFILVPLILAHRSLRCILIFYTLCISFQIISLALYSSSLIFTFAISTQLLNLTWHIFLFVCFKYVFYISRYSVWVCFNKFHLTLHCVNIFIEHLKYACVCTILMFIFDSSVIATGN